VKAEEIFHIFPVERLPIFKAELQWNWVS